ncbi:hypothetical protein K469DRAFT_720979, partial [Zopfia rhizophila CBS 207.26]
MDEIGFMRGDIGTAKVVTAVDGPKYHIQPGDPKHDIPAMVIAKGKQWKIALSETGWTNDKLGYIWLTQVFDPAMKEYTTGTKRLL